MGRGSRRDAQRRCVAATPEPRLTLVDTSIWIEVFRRHRPLDLEAIVPFDEVVTCLPVFQEVLQGFRDEGAFRIARDAMKALPLVEAPMPVEVYEQAVDLFRQARRAGRTIRSPVDCLIAACAIRHDLEILHRDRDFEALASISSLRVREV